MNIISIKYLPLVEFHKTITVSKTNESTHLRFEKDFGEQKLAEVSQRSLNLERRLLHCYANLYSFHESGTIQIVFVGLYS